MCDAMGFSGVSDFAPVRAVLRSFGNGCKHGSYNKTASVEEVGTMFLAFGQHVILRLFFIRAARYA
jgi:hypothetical protein